MSKYNSFLNQRENYLAQNPLLVDATMPVPGNGVAAHGEFADGP